MCCCFWTNTKGNEAAMDMAEWLKLLAIQLFQPERKQTCHAVKKIISLLAAYVAYNGIFTNKYFKVTRAAYFAILFFYRKTKTIHYSCIIVSSVHVFPVLD